MLAGGDNMATITVLAIDGGGIRGMIPAAFLNELEKEPGKENSYEFNAWDVARATSAAPTYFPPHRATAMDGQTYALIDGGMYANNPALCAWVEAHDRHPGADILVVSIGTGAESKPVRFEDAANWGLAGWAPHLI